MKRKTWTKPFQDINSGTIEIEETVEKNEPDNSPIIEPVQSKVKVLAHSLNVRVEPTRESKVLTKVKKDDILVKIENNTFPGIWINVIVDGKSGWVMKEYTQEV